MLETWALAHPHAPAFFQRHPHAPGGETRYLSLTFLDFVHEQNAWVNTLLSSGVAAGDKVALWLPPGLGQQAAFYALIKLGAEAIVLDAPFDWKRGRPLLQHFGPRYLIGSRQTAKLVRSRFSGIAGLRQAIEAPPPLIRIGSLGRASGASLCPAPLREPELTVIATPSRSRPQAQRFTQRQLAAMASTYRSHFPVDGDAIAIGARSLLSLLQPAMGTATVSLECSDERPAPPDTVAQTIEQLGVNIAYGDRRFWAALAAETATLPSLSQALIAAPRLPAREVQAAQRLAPRAAVHLVLGGGFCPIAAELTFPRRPESAIGTGQASQTLDRPAPKLLPGIAAKLTPLGDHWNTSDSANGTPLGIIALSGAFAGSDALAPNGQAATERWTQTDWVGHVDERERLHYRGAAADLVHTPFGVFAPERCEAVFEQHPHARRAVLVTVRRDGKTRPGIVVETGAENLPSTPIEQSRFKAELLRLGAATAETALILDFHFAAALPSSPDSPDEVDRSRVSARFSKRRL